MSDKEEKKGRVTRSKIADDVAEVEFKRFGEMMDLDFDKESMDADDKEGFLNSKRPVMLALQRGSLIINESGEPTFIPQRTKWEHDPITFSEPTGATYMAMDRKKRNQDMGKVFIIMAEMTGFPSATLSKLKGSDIKVCQAITTLFLA